MVSKRILITGGAGFVGSQLGHYLSRKGFDVLLIDNMSYGHLDNLIIDGSTFGTLKLADIREKNLADLFKGVDTVFHFAGIAPLPVCQADPCLAYSVNTAAVGNVIELARLANVRRVIFSSTSAVYENVLADRLSETEVVKPDLVYSMTKLAAEQLCQSYSKNFGVDVVIARFFNVYGPHQDFKRKSPPFTGYIARELALSRKPILFNKSPSRRDYVYVTDVIRLLEQMMISTKHFASEIFNIGSGKSYSVDEIFSRLQQIAGTDIEPVYKESAGFWDAYDTLFDGTKKMSRDRVEKEVHKNSLADIEKAAREFGWKPEITIEDGLGRVFTYAQANLKNLAS
jgi:UDP-glucose 4-epimerase